MSNLEPKTEGTPLPPEELQAQTMEAYLHLPQYLPLGRRDSLPNILRVGHRGISETMPIMQKKFDGLIAQSPTCDSFKTVMHKVVGEVFKLGRKADNSNHNPEMDNLLVKVLQLKGSQTGIYTPAGAQKGENILFQWVQEQLLTSTQFALDQGFRLDSQEALTGDAYYPSILGNGVSIGTLLGKWLDEYVTRYGTQPPL